MSNHIAGNWFVSVFKMFRMTNKELTEIANNNNYRESTRRNARLAIDNRNYH